jgi:hypothetical protein
MPEQPKNHNKPSEPRAFDAALESSLLGLRVARASQQKDASPETGPEQLTVQPPQPEIVSRLVNFIKKI